jgi:voltage-gated potassium channel
LYQNRELPSRTSAADNRTFPAGGVFMLNLLKKRLKIALVAFFAVMVLGTVGFMAVENRSLIDAAYFVIVSMATVGYGDIHPLTQLGKIFTMILIITGVGSFLGVVANLTEIILARREVERRMEKLNMVIGVFFSEIGLGLMARASEYDPLFDEIRPKLIVTALWTDRRFAEAGKDARAHDYMVRMDRVDLADLKSFLLGRREFMLGLLTNPALMEHQSFTDLLQAVSHVAEELAYRSDLLCLPHNDLDHLAYDIKRVYHLLVGEWLDYMKYLKHNYPFLFSLAMRTNPFDKNACVVLAGEG